MTSPAPYSLKPGEMAAIDATVLASVLRRTSFDEYGLAPITSELAGRIADVLDVLASECGTGL